MTGVQTCALPIWRRSHEEDRKSHEDLERERVEAMVRDCGVEVSEVSGKDDFGQSRCVLGADGLVFVAWTDSPDSPNDALTRSVQGSRTSFSTSPDASSNARRRLNRTASFDLATRS